MIVCGDPNESKLFQAVDDEIMPTDDEGEDPLPASEKEIIRRWILVGAPRRRVFPRRYIRDLIVHNTEVSIP